MRKTTFLTRVLALVLSVMLVLTGMPMAVFAEEEQSSETQETLDASEITESSTDEAAAGTGEDTVEDQPVMEETEDAAELEPDDVLSEITPDDAEPDLSVEDGNPDETVTDAEIVLDEEEFPVIDEAEDEIVWEDEEQDDYMIVERPMLRSAINPSRFTGAEEVRLGKEGNNIYGIIVQKDGSSSTSITRHWVTVDGVKYTAFCIESSDASTSGRDGGLEPGMDAGLLWILCNVPDTSDEDYAIKQQAIWAYLGQSFSIRNLAAGSRCSLSTDQLRERLTDIVTNAQNATITGTQELWIAYHLDNRDYYQDMAFIVDEPEPTPTPVPTPTPIPLEPGMIQVMKQDAQTGAMLAGATFELISGSTVIATGTTGPDGVVVFVNIMPGTYTIREASAPEGYTLGDVTVQSATVANAQLVTVAFANDKRSSCIRILKTDAQTGEPLEGARFMITRLTGPSVVSGMAIGESITLETDVNVPFEDRIDIQGLRKSGQMHKVRLSKNDYQLVAESAGQSPEVLMSNYNEALDSEKRALSRMVEGSFYPQQETATPAPDEVTALVAKLQQNPDLQRQLLQNLLLGAVGAQPGAPCKDSARLADLIS